MIKLYCLISNITISYLNNVLVYCFQMKVDFEKPVKIAAVATQGREDANQYVKRYTLAYRNDGDFKWTDYRDKAGNVKVNYCC